MTTTTTTRDLEALPDTARLVVTFPLSGQSDSGYRVWIVDEGTDLERYAVTDATHGRRAGARVIREFYNIANAIALCLANSGWGSFTIKEQQQ